MKARRDYLTAMLDLQSSGSALERQLRKLPLDEMSLVVKLVIKAPGNSRFGVNRWQAAKRAEAHRFAVYHAWERERWPRDVKPGRVTLARMAEKPLDGDGLQAGMKHVRDQVARMCGIDDREPEVWEYVHEHSEEFGVRITVDWRRDAS